MKVETEGDEDLFGRSSHDTKSSHGETCIISIGNDGSHQKKKKVKGKSPSRTKSKSPGSSASPVRSFSSTRAPVDVAACAFEHDNFAWSSQGRSTQWKLVIDKNRSAGSGQVECARKTCQDLDFMAILEVLPNLNHNS